MCSFIVLRGCYCNKIHDYTTIYHEMKRMENIEQGKKICSIFSNIVLPPKIHNNKNYKNQFLKKIILNLLFYDALTFCL